MKILVIDDDMDFCLCMGDMIRLHPDMELVGTANNGKEACIKIDQLRPELILLDHCMPILDGIGVISWLIKTLPSYKPYIFCMSAWEVSHMVIPEQIRSAITYVVRKPVEWNVLKERILQLSANKEAELKFQAERIKHLLLQFELCPHTEEYRLIHQALLLIFQQRDVVRNITGVLYPRLSSQFHISTKSTERKIRYEIERIFTKKNNAQIQQIFYQTSPDKGKLTNKQFLILLAKKLGYL